MSTTTSEHLDTTEGSALEFWKKERIIISQQRWNYKQPRVPSVTGMNTGKAHLFLGCYTMTGLSTTADEPHPEPERTEVICKCALNPGIIRFLKSWKITYYIAERDTGQSNLITTGWQCWLTCLKLSL